MTTFTGSRATKSFSPIGGHVAAAYGSIAISTAPVIGDVYQLVALPKGARVVGGSMWLTDADTGDETLDMDLGWAANGVEAASVSGLINSGVLSGDAVVDVLPAGVNKRDINLAAGAIAFNAETTIQAQAIAAAATFAAATLHVTVLYILP